MRTFQPELKLYFARRFSGWSYAPTTIEAYSSATQPGMNTRFIALIESLLNSNNDQKKMRFTSQ